jgi:hypothetical protein
MERRRWMDEYNIEFLPDKSIELLKSGLQLEQHPARSKKIRNDQDIDPYGNLLARRPPHKH